MDFEILPQLIIVFSIAGILVIVGKNFSKVKEASSEEIFLEESEKEKHEKEKFLYLYKRATRRINKEDYQKKMAQFWVWFEKFLRKLRIMILKVDGRMVSILEQLRKKNIESLEEFKKKAELNIHREKTNEALSKFWANKGFGSRHRAAKEGTAVPTAQEEILIPAVGAVTAETGFETTEPTNTVIKEAYSSLETVQQEEILEQQEMIAKDMERTAEAAETYETELQQEIETLEETDDVEIANMEEVPETVEPEQLVNREVTGTEPAAYSEEMPAAAEEKEIKEKEETEEEKKIRTRKEQEYIEILMKNPMDIKAYWKLGIIYSKRRNYDDALACFRQIVKIDPTYTKAKQKAIELMEKMKGKVK